MRKRYSIFVLLSAIAVAALTLPGSGKAEQTAGPDPRPGACAPAIEIAERASGIPVHLLQAISLTESGRWSDAHNAFIAWPWTVMAEGKGRYLPTKQAAIAEVRALQARGVTNIDVGCMQVNLFYHGKAFGSLEEAFDPIHNVAYATAFLLDLRQRWNSWTRAVQTYHSNNPERRRAYENRVMANWDSLKKGRPIAGRETGLEGNGYSYLSATQWPPRDFGAQRRLEAAARARVMSNF
jgi:soluble lytic murein transglycosylase-like protein